MKILLKGSLLSVSFICIPGCSETQGAERLPNFVVLFIDDMGYGDIGPFGSSLNRTPNLDRMAEEGMRLTNLNAAPLCTQSRAALMTGSYLIRVGLMRGTWHPVLMPGDEHGLNPDEMTIAELLKEHIGKQVRPVGYFRNPRPLITSSNGKPVYQGDLKVDFAMWPSRREVK